MIMMTSGIIGNECKIKKSLYIILMRDKTALYINCTKSVYEFKLRVLKKEYMLFQYFSYTYKTYMRSSTKNNIIANLGVQTMNDLLRHSSRLTHTHTHFSTLTLIQTSTFSFIVNNGNFNLRGSPCSNSSKFSGKERSKLNTK